MSTIFLIRHGEKVSDEVHAPLSKKGIEDSIEFGKRLKKSKKSLDIIKTSPIIRCIQTAEYIKKGYGKELVIEESKLLGNPGIFIEDDKKAMEVFEKNALIDIVNTQLENKRLSGFRDIKSGSDMLKELMKKDLKNNKNALYISHDAVITPYIFFLEKKVRIDEKEIVNFLSGGEFIIQDTKLECNKIYK